MSGKAALLDRLQENILILDGAVGSLLLEKGFQAGSCLEELNLTHPEAIDEIHRAYFQSGSQIVETNTFGANRNQLEKHGLGDKVSEINSRAVKIAREASPDFGYVLGSIGPSGLLIKPIGEISFDQVYDIFTEQALALAEAGVDGLIVETITDIQEARAALLAIKENTDLPVVVTLTYGTNLRTELSGTSPASAAIILSSLGADLIGLNCGLGPDLAVDILNELAQYSNVPLVVQPNAGLPRLQNGKTVFPATPEDMAKFVPGFVKAGAKIIGACCGSTPNHIAKISFAKADLKPVELDSTGVISVASSQKALAIKRGGRAYLVGERLNPSGRSELTKSILSGDYSLLQDEARLQADKGVDLLDVNVGVAGIDEVKILPEVVEAISQSVDTPLMLDSANPEALERALRYYPGRAIVNSVSGRRESLATILPLVKKYGAMVVGLTLDDNGLPETTFDRIDNARLIIDEAIKAGLRKEDVIIDPLVLTAATNQESITECLEAVRQISQTLSILTILGISNVSHGLPNRDSINKAFLAMAISAGLNLAFIDPTKIDAVEIAYAGSYLSNRDFTVDELLEKLTNQPLEKEEKIAHNVDPKEKLTNSIISGQAEKAQVLVEENLHSGMLPLDIINQILTPALQVVGDKFGQGQIFLPQVLASAEAVKKSFKRLKKEISQEQFDIKGKFVFATVEGDIHNIGKDICISLLESNSYKVIDLGVDVPARFIIEKAIENSADAIALSALMTTTLPAMEEAVELVKEKSLQIPVFVGGAVVSSDYASKIGADFYSEDAIELIKIADEFFQK